MHLSDEKIQEYLDGLIPPDDPVQVHLENCPVCRQKLEHYRSLFGALDSQSEIFLSNDFADRVTAAVPEWPKTETIKGRPIGDNAILGIAMVLIIIGGIVFLKPLKLLQSLTGMDSIEAESSHRILNQTSDFFSFIGVSPELFFGVVGVIAIVALVDRLIVRRFRRGLISLMF